MNETSNNPYAPPQSSGTALRANRTLRGCARPALLADFGLAIMIYPWILIALLGVHWEVRAEHDPYWGQYGFRIWMFFAAATAGLLGNAAILLTRRADSWKWAVAPLLLRIAMQCGIQLMDAIHFMLRVPAIPGRGNMPIASAVLWTLAALWLAFYTSVVALGYRQKTTIEA